MDGHMQSDRFRLVIVGAGAISHAAHVPAALASPFVDLVGVVDTDVDRAKALCRDYGLDIAVAGDASQLSMSFDGAVVASPNDTHAPIARALIQQGAHVLIEKPMATDTATAQGLVELSNANGVTVAIGFHTRHSGACRAMKQAIDAEHFGRAIRFAHQDGSRGGWSPLSGYNLDGRAGGGVLVTTGTHFLDRLIWLWGSPTTVSFRDNSLGGPESHCIARFGFQRDGTVVSGSAVFSKVVSLAESTVVQTTEGLLIMHSDAAERIIFRPGRDAGLEYEVGLRSRGQDSRSLYQRELEDFVAACQAGTRPCVDAAVGAQSVELVTRLYAAREPLAGNTADAREVEAHA
jgi:predicted dehydrogenase